MADTGSILAVGGAIIGAAGALVAAPVALGAIGFGAAGVTAGSMAAAAQATMGGFVAKGSLFALCQSWGAAGIPVVAKGVLATAGAVLGYNVGD
ncbi:interferon alpha-inducible protein 27-like protein 2A [Dermacentor albipictus]|uniref:interferon alpha-inducible protein 27-like protein 2A n=1 Tax=Dermacentor albipictus TaxID=60249 RepID=UPI0031FD1C99